MVYNLLKALPSKMHLQPHIPASPGAAPAAAVAGVGHVRRRGAGPAALQPAAEAQGAATTAGAMARMGMDWLKGTFRGN